MRDLFLEMLIQHFSHDLKLVLVFKNSFVKVFCKFIFFWKQPNSALTIHTIDLFLWYDDFEWDWVLHEPFELSK